MSINIFKSQLPPPSKKNFFWHLESIKYYKFPTTVNNKYKVINLYIATFLLLSVLILMGCSPIKPMASTNVNKQTVRAYPGCVLPQVASFVADGVIVFGWTQKLHLLDDILPFLFGESIPKKQAC